MVLELETGERYRFGTTHIEQNVIDDSLVRRYMRYQQDEPFDMTEILRTQFALDDSQYFSNVEVLPGDPDRDAARRAGQHPRRPEPPQPLLVRPRLWHRYRDIRGTLQWEDRRINQAGHRFNVLARAAEEQRSLESHYIIPIGDPALEKLGFETTYQKQQLADVDTRILKFEPSITHVSGPLAAGVLPDVRQRKNELGGRRTRRTSCVMPGISLALVPQGYLGEALFSNAVLRAGARLIPLLGLELRLRAARHARPSTRSTSAAAGTCSCGARSAPASSRSSASCRSACASSPAAIAACAASVTTSCRPRSP